MQTLRTEIINAGWWSRWPEETSVEFIQTSLTDRNNAGWWSRWHRGSSVEFIQTLS